MLDNLLRDKNFKHIIFDFETCNTNTVLNTNLVWQLGLLICEGKNIIEEKEFFLKWNNLNISEGAAKVTKFNIKEYNDKAEDPLPVFNLLSSYIYNEEYRIIFHNGLKFEVPVYNIFRKLMGFNPDFSYLNRVIDTNALAKGIKSNYYYKNGENFLAYQFRAASIIKKGLKSSLTTLGKEFGFDDVNYENLHRAIEDCRLNKRIWEKIKWEVEI